MKILYLHMGTHKTGTSSLQYYLNNYKEVLKDNNACYPFINNNCERAPWSNSPHINGSFLLEPKDSNNYKNALKIIEECFNEFNNVIISEEFLSLLTIEPSWNPWFRNVDFINNLKLFYEFLKSINVSLKAIVYLRRQDKYSESMICEYAKSAVIFNSIDEYKNTFINVLDYYSMIEKISFVFDGNIVVRNYEKLINNDICEDFFNTIGFKNYKKYRININSKLELNAFYFQCFLIKNKMGSSKFCYTSLQNGYHHFKNWSLFSKDDAISLVNTYKNSNAMLYEKYNIKFSDDYSNYVYKYNPDNQYMKKDKKVFIKNFKNFIENEMSNDEYNHTIFKKVKTFLKKFKLFRGLNNIRKKIRSH